MTNTGSIGLKPMEQPPGRGPVQHTGTDGSESATNAPLGGGIFAALLQASMQMLTAGPASVVKATGSQRIDTKGRTGLLAGNARQPSGNQHAMQVPARGTTPSRVGSGQQQRTSSSPNPTTVGNQGDKVTVPDADAVMVDPGHEAKGSKDVGAAKTPNPANATTKGNDAHASVPLKSGLTGQMRFTVPFDGQSATRRSSVNTTMGSSRVPNLAGKPGTGSLAAGSVVATSRKTGDHGGDNASTNLSQRHAQSASFWTTSIQQVPWSVSHTSMHGSEVAAPPSQSWTFGDLQQLYGLTHAAVHQLEGGQHQIQVQVHPAGLGNVTISVAQTAAGGISVHLQADQTQTLQWLDQQVQVLQGQLQQNGVDVTGVSVSMTSTPHGNNGGSDTSDRRGKSQSGTTLLAKSRDGPVDASGSEAVGRVVGWQSSSYQGWM